MDGLKIPFDNLYKFVAIAGVALVGLGLALPYRVAVQAMSEYYKILEEQAQADVDYIMWSGRRAEFQMRRQQFEESFTLFQQLVRAREKGLKATDAEEARFYDFEDLPFDEGLDAVRKRIEEEGIPYKTIGDFPPQLQQLFREYHDSVAKQYEPEMQKWLGEADEALDAYEQHLSEIARDIDRIGEANIESGAAIDRRRVLVNVRAKRLWHLRIAFWVSAAIGVLSSVAGAWMMWWGFRRWYLRLQVHQDTMTERQARQSKDSGSQEQSAPNQAQS